MDSRIGIFWLREDFRLTRNDALAYASQNHEKVITIYFYKKKLFEDRRAQKWWLFKSLENFLKFIIIYSQIPVPLSLEKMRKPR